METTFSVLLASQRPRSDAANSQNAATEAAARMRGRPILALMRISDIQMPGRDAAIQVIVQQAKGGLTDRLLYASLLADGVDSFDTGRLELRPGI